jgi:aminobenzoyl-glutamate utilization protein B
MCEAVTYYSVMFRLRFFGCFALSVAAVAAAEDAKLQAMKADALGQVQSMAKQTQVMVDSVFSFGELGFQEIETSRYLTGLLEKEGFRVQRGVAGIPTAWVATWGSGKPVIALGSDIDGIPQASQKPGVAYHDPMIAGAPGHGEGHNSGQAVNLTAAFAVKRIMEREKIPGTLMLWPGVAEEQLGTKAYYIRAGLFKNVDAVIFTHVAAELAVTGGPSNNTGLVSVEYRFEGESAHSAGAPWRGRSALDAVELMNIGWNFRREHLPLGHRSHYVITNGGDQPNVVPRNASVWYFFREADYDGIQKLWNVGNRMAEAAAMMTDTKQSSRVLGTAWPGHFSKPIAEAMTANIKNVGMPEWSEADQQLAKAVQKELGVKQDGLKLKLDEPKPGMEQRGSAGSDDIGDISWNLPTVVLRFPSNIPNLPGHNWSNAIAMATPIAHKGATAGAKVLALTVLDLLTRPEVTADAWRYFREEQTKETKYQPLIRESDQPAVWLNTKIMEEYRPKMKEFYYDSAKYSTYLEQLGIQYPTVRK